MFFNQPVRLLFVGRPAAEKGLPDLIQSLCSLLRYQWTLSVVGDSPEVDSSLDRALHHLGPARVHFYGRKPNSAIPDIMRAHDVLIVPSHYETFGNVALEGMACGLPVVAAATGGLRQLVTPGVNGFLFCPRDDENLAAVLRIALTHHVLLESMGKMGRELARPYSWDIVVAATQVLLLKLLS